MDAKKSLKIILIVLVVASILFSLYLDVEKNTVCLVSDGPSACEKVQNSVYSTLFGIKLPWYGVAFNAVLLMLLLVGKPLSRLTKIPSEEVLLVLFIGGALFAVRLLILQFFVLKSICSVCQIVDWAAIIACALYVWAYIRSKKQGSVDVLI